VRDLAYNKSSCADAGYLAKVTSAIVEAVTAAYSVRSESNLGFGVGRETEVAFNRRIRMKSGLAFSHPGKGNPDNVDFAGPTDSDVGVIGAWDPDGKLLGCVVNFACHATTNGPWITANWPYYMERAIQGYFGPEAKVVFLQGACGDVTQVNNLDPLANPDGDGWAQFVGGRVGAEAVKTLLGMSQTRSADVPIETRTKVWNIPRRKPAPERIQAALELAAKPEKDAGPDWVWAKETVMLDALLAKWPSVEVEVQAVQVGPVVCLSVPAEYFCRFGLEMKKESGFPMTFPVELANGCVGYVPTLDAFSETIGGGYETRLTSYSNLEITAGDQFRDAAVALARELKPARCRSGRPRRSSRHRGATAILHRRFVDRERSRPHSRSSAQRRRQPWSVRAALAEEALKAFELGDPSLKVELVAAEPLVESPCAIAFDEAGRLFVAENRGYPNLASPPQGDIVLLKDTDGDGRMDERTVFADGLTFPNGVMPWKGGLIVTCAPDVLYFRDTDGDGRADDRRVLLTGFETAKSTQLRVNAPCLALTAGSISLRGSQGARSPARNIPSARRSR
jgi:hypothetical protein